LRNYYPHVSQAQRVAYQFETPTTRVWYNRFASGQASDAQSIFWRVPKAPEELYDLQSDPDEVHNLATSAEHQGILEKLRQAAREHILEVRDVCFLPEHEIHVRSEGTTPYDMAREPGKYPLENVLKAASVAASLDASKIPELLTFVQDKDSAVRFWGIMGLLIRGSEAVTSNDQKLQAALSDSSTDVQIVAAQALGMYGTSTQQELALQKLSDLAQANTHGVLVAMPALAAIEALGTIANSIRKQIGNVNPEGPSPDGRYNSYVPRLLANIAPNTDSSANDKEKKANRRSKK
jgi:uncharacterized sulfatase